MKLRDTIKIIDNSISSKVPFAPKKAFGYAERYYEIDKYYPGIIDGSNITNCFLEDLYDVSWYHRQISSSADASEENSYGNKNDYVTETNQITHQRARGSAGIAVMRVLSSARDSTSDRSGLMPNASNRPRLRATMASECRRLSL